MSWPAYALIAVGIAGLLAVALAGRKRPLPRALAEPDPEPDPFPDFEWSGTFETAVEDAPVEAPVNDAPLAERLRTIAGLADGSGPESGALLVAAYEREAEPAAREAALVALREIRYARCDAVLAEALASSSVSERLRAVELAAAIGAREPLAAAVADPALPVALAAACALVGPERRGAVAAALGAFR